MHFTLFELEMRVDIILLFYKISCFKCVFFKGPDRKIELKTYKSMWKPWISQYLTRHGKLFCWRRWRHRERRQDVFAGSPGADDDVFGCWLAIAASKTASAFCPRLSWRVGQLAGVTVMRPSAAICKKYMMRLEAGTPAFPKVDNWKITPFDPVTWIYEIWTS